MSLPVTYSAREVAASLGIEYRRLTRLARMEPEKYPSLQLGHRVRFTESQVEQILVNLTRAADPVASSDVWGRPAVAVRREANRRRSA